LTNEIVSVVKEGAGCFNSPLFLSERRLLIPVLQNNNGLGVPRLRRGGAPSGLAFGRGSTALRRGLQSGLTLDISKPSFLFLSSSAAEGTGGAAGAAFFAYFPSLMAESRSGSRG